jgi:hypothetical protein
MSEWLTAVVRVPRPVDRTSAADRWAADRVAMVDLPPVTAEVGLTGRIRLRSDY